MHFKFPPPDSGKVQTQTQTFADNYLPAAADKPATETTVLQFFYQLQLDHKHITILISYLHYWAIIAAIIRSNADRLAQVVLATG